MVQRERALEAIGRDVPGRQKPPTLSDQHVDGRQSLQDLLGHTSDLRLAGQIRDEHLNRATGDGPNLSGGGRGTVGSRPVIATWAPMAPRPTAVALPIPPVPPVTSTVSPVIGFMGAVLRMLVLITDLVVITAATGDTRVSKPAANKPRRLRLVNPNRARFHDGDHDLDTRTPAPRRRS